MAAKAHEARLLSSDIQFLINILRGIQVSGLGFVYCGEIPVPNGIQARLSHSISFSSWGEDITITMTAQDNQTLVDILSKCSLPTQIVDYGKNKKNVNEIFNYLMQSLSAYNQAVAQPQPNVSICPNCGKQLDSFGSFCSGCGTKVR